MMFNNRRMYINRYPVNPKSIDSNNSPDVQSDSDFKKTDDAEDNKKLILDTFKSINDTFMEKIKEIHRSISNLSERVENLENQMLLLESQIESEESCRSQISHSELSNIKTELEILRRDSSNIQFEENGNMPVMPGSGFSAITAEYLRNLNKR
ncbi:hypothetical protein [Acetivibrio straminisolvens]|uniref:Uncharacterized protein n=1 Tax=Acetivibrio straminisolvens JCM 21531 TaxID=1294263 RepID=W4V5L7_9FIRM|nr:hypothetical protein [Acetivibrio straminisolvens]GAE88049.1 hypothetical protein JCM21531_1466 [Acetivibrio straminisolvens JCM 21531]